jgi:EAL domain-containing protein (putative c-di-GMP-specific phosphodiesterase class I)
LLRLLNCDEMQGFLFSRPLPRESFERKYLTGKAGALSAADA